MLELLNDIFTVAHWFFFDFVPIILTAQLGAIGEFLDTIDGIKYLIGAAAIVGGAGYALYKRYIR